MQRVSLQAAYVLHQRDFKNTSRIIDIYSADYGRIGLVANGVRNSKKGRQYLLQPFRPLLISWAGRGELLTLTHVESTTAPDNFLSGKSLICGYYLNELILRLTPQGDSNPALFQHYHNSLLTLAQGTDYTEILRAFEIELLDLLGYGLQLDVDSQGEPIKPAQQYYYGVELGPLSVPPAGMPTIAISGESLLALASGQGLTNTGQLEAKKLMRGILQYYLGDKPLKSREVFRQLFTAT